MKLALIVATGGALGAVGRYYVGVAAAALIGAGYPWGTLTVNVLGCFTAGVLIETMALVWHGTTELQALLIVGFLGGFTTFSAFSVETILMMERGDIGAAVLYVLVTVALSVGAMAAGLHAMRGVLT